MHISELKESRFLKKEECDPPILVTIREVNQENIAKEGAPQEYKWCVHFNELEKPMVLNSTNGQLIAKIVGSDESDDWTGTRIVLYHDPNVSFGGKLTGGIRVRAPKQKTGVGGGGGPPSKPPKAAPPASEEEDPF